MKTQRKESSLKTSQGSSGSELATTLQSEVDEAVWSWLKPHAERDAIILVSGELNLVEVGLALAADDSKAVQAWMEKGKLYKPSADEIKTWDALSTKRFLTLVIQPYVLAQEITVH